MVTSASQPTEDRPRRILLVDDELPIRTVAGTILRQQGYDVLLAEDGAQALELYHRHPGIDLVILDLSLPQESGEDVLRQLRAIDPATRALFSSGAPAEEVLADLTSQDVGYIRKPYHLQELLDAVQAALQPPAGP